MLIGYFILGDKLEISSTKIINSNVFIPDSVSALNASFQGKDGINYKLNELVTGEDQLIIHFWATWCGPCLDEIPKLFKYSEATYAANKNIKVIYIAINDKWELIDQFLAKAGVIKNTFSYFLLDNENTSYNHFRVDKVPETFLLRDGKVERLVGPQEWKL
jgi:thiol-disulfide isomerase/thioredoxin